MTEASATAVETAPTVSGCESTNITPSTAFDHEVLTIDGGRNTPSTSASTKSRDNGHRHHRVNSEGSNGLPHQQRRPPSQYPPTQIVYKNNNTSNIGNNNNNDLGVPPLIPGYPHNHSRERSWSGGTFPAPAGYATYPFPVGLPPPGPYPQVSQVMMGHAQQPLIPSMMPGAGLPPSMIPMNTGAPIAMISSNQDTIGSTGSTSSRRSKRKDYPGHRRVHSYNGCPNNSYGSMDAASFFAPPGAVPPLPPTAPRTPRPTTPRAGGKHSRTDSGDFSPVSEIRNLTGGGYRSERSPRAAPPSPRTTPHHHVHVRSLSGDGSLLGGHLASIPPPLMMPNSFDPSCSLNQYQQSPRPFLPHRGVYTGVDTDDDSNLLRDTSSRITSSIRGTIRGASDGRVDGGEAVFLLNNDSDKKTKKHSRSAPKMHMRQKSAQLFMEDVKGTEQIPSCRDIVFVLLFLFHLLGIVYLGNTYGRESLRMHDETIEDSDSSITIVYMNLIYIAGMSGIVGVVISGLTLVLMTTIVQKIVQIALGLAITFSFVWGTMGIGLSPRKIVPITGIIALALFIAYAFIVWDRIPFATANLNAGLKGIRSSPGAVVVAFVFQFLALVWSIYYTYVLVGVYDAIQLGDLGRSFYAMIAISCYWTLNVFLNIVQVTVAGVIGSWWYKADGDTSSSGTDLRNAFFRSCFYSIGSICFGSLVVGPVRILRQLSAFFRPSEEVRSLLCLHECIHCIQTCMTSCVDTLGDRFNTWSFTYVGLYGYGLLDAGLHSTELFEKRGWTTIVSDDLVPNVLTMISLAIGGFTGMLAYLLENVEGLSLTSLGVPLMTSFGIGFLVGLVVSSILFGIISSSVNTVIVLFAASPVDFEQNHPKLSEEMRNAWREVWPGCMEVMDMRVHVAGYMDATTNGPMTVSERHPLLP